MDIKTVYIEAIVMPNNEVLHFGKSLGFINEAQRDLLETENSGACKLTKPGQPIVALKPNVA